MKKISFMLIIIFIFLLAASYNNYLQDDYKINQDEIIRFHIKANSDSDDDQALKLRIRDELLNQIQGKFTSSQSIEGTREIIKKNIPFIQEYTEKIVKEQGKDLRVAVDLQMREFPTRKYGDHIYPQGKYETLHISLGAGQGKNWWCVMFPPLCLVDLFGGKIEIQEDKLLEDDKDNNQEIDLYKEKEDIKYTDSTPQIIIRSKIVEIFSSKTRDIFGMSTRIK